MPVKEPPTTNELEEQALKFLRDCRPQEYKELKARGAVEEYCQQKVEAAQRAAENLISQGTFPPQAWNTAIRTEILECQSD